MTLLKDPYEQFLLDYLVTKLKNGSNTKNALVLFKEQINKQTPFKKRLEAAIFDLEKGKMSLEAVLHKHKFLNKFQYNLVSNSHNITDGLELVLSFEKSSSNLITKMLYPIFVPMLIMMSSFYSLIIYLAMLEKDLIDLRKINPEVEQFLNVPKYFNYDFAYFGLGATTILTLIMFFGYMYSEQWRPGWLYKVFKTQAYSDGRFMFRILNKMLSAGISLNNCSLILSKDYFKVGLRPFFLDLANAIQRNKRLYTAFEKYNFPVLVTADIKLSELSKTNYADMTKALYQTCDSMFDRNLKFLILQWRFFFWLTAVVVSVIIGSDIINIVISTFSFKTLYM